MEKPGSPNSHKEGSGAADYDKTNGQNIIISMNLTRYRYETVELGPVEQAELRLTRLQEANRVLERRISQAREAMDDLRELIASPWETTRKIQISLQPGDPGYDEAPVTLHFENYQGDFTWINHPNATH